MLDMTYWYDFRFLRFLGSSGSGHLDPPAEGRPLVMILGTSSSFDNSHNADLTTIYFCLNITISF